MPCIANGLRLLPGCSILSCGRSFEYRESSTRVGPSSIGPGLPLSRQVLARKARSHLPGQSIGTTKWIAAQTDLTRFTVSGRTRLLTWSILLCGEWCLPYPRGQPATRVGHAGPFRVCPGSAPASKSSSS